MGILNTLLELRKVVIIIIVPLALSPLLIEGTPQSKSGFCLLLMAIFWVAEVFPIAVTALLPVMLLPATGLMTGKQVSSTYINDSSMLFVGGLIMAVAIEHWNIHKRIALKMLLLVGTEPTRLILGMMLPSWFLSMWTSNMATTAMMCPIADALLNELHKGETEQLEENVSDQQPLQNYKEKNLEPCETNLDLELVVDGRMQEKSSASHGTIPRGLSKEHAQLAKAMTISIAYAANIGGTTTITGCASNIILKGMVDDMYREKGLDSPISFGSWLVLGFPVSLLNFIMLYSWLTLFFRGCSCCKKNSRDSRHIRVFIQNEYNALGAFRFPEIMVITLFIILIILWVSRDLGGAGGWGNIFKDEHVTDSAAPTLIAALLFFIPANLPEFFRKDNRATTVKPLLTWKIVQEKLPWGLFLLFGGGFALAQACKVSGLSSSIKEALTVFQDLPVWLTSLLVALLTSFITEVVTNTATCTIVLPIIAQLALGIGVNPLYLMIPTAVATSYAFMLPVGTPPNAMVYCLGYFSMPEMMKAGFIMNLIAVLILTFGVNTWGAVYYNLHTLPSEFMDHIETTTMLNITHSTNLSSSWT